MCAVESGVSLEDLGELGGEGVCTQGGVSLEVLLV